MLRWNPKILSMAAAFSFVICGQYYTKIDAQELRPQNDVHSYYSRSDVRVPAVHPDSSVIRRNPNTTSQPTANSTQEATQKDFVHQQYQQMLSSTKLKTQTEHKDYAFPSSYKINPFCEKYVRKQLPERLIPPGRADANDSTKRLNRPIQRNRPSADQRQPSRYNQQIPQTSQAAPLPRIVQPNEVHGSISRPVYYSNAVTNHSTTEPTINPHQAAGQSESPQTVITGSSQIPAGYTYDQSMVTRARILIAQQGGDPFGQVPKTKTQDSSPIQDDPFADPAGNNNPANQDFQDPFADPPADLDPNNNPPQDPFENPPTDLTPQKDRQDPFGELPNKINEIDPFPETPGNIQPSSEFNLPEQPRDQTDELKNPDPDPGIAPDKDPAQNRESNRPKLPSGPFYSPGFDPTPILPAPPRRDLEYLTPIVVDSPGFIQAYPDEYSDQPSNFGSEFQKSELYEGITNQGNGYSNDYFPAQEIRPRLINRFWRNSVFVDGCRPGFLSSRDNASCYEFECYGCDSNGDDYQYEGDCFDAGCCFEPMFYVSLFGGYTQLEDSRPSLANDIGFFPALGGPGSLQFNDGFGVGAAIGQYQGNNLRTELEFSFRSNAPSVYDLDFNTAFNSDLDLDGKVQSFSGMFNLIWDLNHRPVFGRTRPYVGGGIGFSFLDFDFSEGGSSILAEDLSSNSSFAYQLMAGLSRAISPNMDGFIEYRFFRADATQGANAGRLQFLHNLDYDTNNIFFGIRKHF